MNLRAFFFRQKYRLDQSLSLLVIVNFCLLVLTASDKLKAFLGIESTAQATAFIIVGVFAGIWLTGYILEKKVKYQAGLEEASYRHSFLWMTLDRHLNELKTEIKELKTQVENQEKK
jgi:hypothetical protein